MRMKVLIVDDFRDGAESLSALVKMLGHSTRITFDGREALDTARHWRPEVVLLDIAMPDMDGYAVATRMREELIDAPLRIVAVSGYPADASRQQTAGIDEYLLKPVSAAVIRRAIEG
jgi:CheY-like chemotaxis protein